MRISHAIGRVPATSVTIPNGQTTNHFHFQAEGFLRAVLFTLNNNTNNVQSTFSITDDQGFTLWTSVAQNENTSGAITTWSTTDVTKKIVLYNSEHTFTITSADPGASGNIATISLLIER